MTHTPKDSMVKSEGKHVSSSQSHGSNHVHYQEDPNLTKVEYGDHYEKRFMKPKKLKANIEYTTSHGHVYRTDHKGRKKKYMQKILHLMMAAAIHTRNEQLEEKTDYQMMTVVI